MFLAGAGPTPRARRATAAATTDDDVPRVVWAWATRQRPSFFSLESRAAILTWQGRRAAASLRVLTEGLFELIGTLRLAPGRESGAAERRSQQENEIELGVVLAAVSEFCPAPLIYSRQP
jgi:hypothetical protein